MTDTYAKPEPDDYMAVLENSKGEGFDVFVEISEITGFSSKELDCRYRKIGSNSDKWTFLHGMQIYEHELDTGEKTDAIFNKFAEELKEAIKKVFRAQSIEIPESGFERLDWLVKNRLTVKDNMIEVTNGNE